MTIAEVIRKFVIAIGEIYSLREAESIARITFEDAFQIRDFKSVHEFSKGNFQKLQGIQNRLLLHEPLQYILGQADFYGLKFKVNPSVLIPRQETEELVSWVLETTERTGKTNLKILDIGTGSGCIAISLKKKMPGLQMTAIDVSVAALAVAKKNAAWNGVEVEFIPANILNESDWQKVGRQDIIVSNPPYITKEESPLLSKNVKDYEPACALFVPGENPLTFSEKIGDFALQKLSNGGFLFFETNPFYAENTLKMLSAKGFKNGKLKQDINERDRMIRVVKYWQ